MRTLRLCATLGLLLLAPCAHAAYDLRITRTAGDNVVTVTPGTAVDLTLRFENVGDAPSAADLQYNVFVDRLDVDPEYTFQMQA